MQLGIAGNPHQSMSKDGESYRNLAYHRYFSLFFKNIGFDRMSHLTTSKDVFVKDDIVDPIKQSFALAQCTFLA